LELREAAQRILWHFKLLLICVGIGMLVPYLLSRQQEPTYEATMRILVSAGTDASVTADTVAAVATSRTQLQGALHDVRADRDPVAFAHAVSVRSVGTSGTVDLSVIDEDPVVAAAAANALTTRVIHVLRASGLAKFPLPSVIESASPGNAVAVSHTRVQDIAFGGLLGLVIGIVAAALLEALSPTVIGRKAIAAELRAPVLGVLPNMKGKPTSRELPWLRWQLEAQATRSDVATVELTTAGPSLDLVPLSVALHEAAVTSRSQRVKSRSGGGTRVNGGAASDGPDQMVSRPAPGLKIRVLDRTDELSFHSNGSAGVVVVTPTVVKRADMDSARELLGLTGWPAVGVIVYRRSRIVRSLDRVAAGADPSGQPSRRRRFLRWRRGS
jgi:capsular polysaccharide biosynthesis protein